MRGFLNFYVDTAINHSGGGGNTPSFNLKITNWSWEILDLVESGYNDNTHSSTPDGSEHKLSVL